MDKWGQYSHIHLCCTSHRRSDLREEPLGSCSLQAVKGEQIFHPGKASPALPVQQLLLFKQWKHFHRHFPSSWNSASWTARDVKGADLGDASPEMTVGSTPLGTGRPPRDSGSGEGVMAANFTLCYGRTYQLSIQGVEPNQTFSLLGKAPVQEST